MACRQPCSVHLFATLALLLCLVSGEGRSWEQNQPVPVDLEQPIPEPSRIMKAEPSTSPTVSRNDILWVEKDALYTYDPHTVSRVNLPTRDVYNGWEWVEVGTDSVGDGGISDNDGDSQHPSLAPGGEGVPCIAWQDDSSGSLQVYVRRWSGIGRA